jgi:hypothetical protein
VREKWEERERERERVKEGDTNKKKMHFAFDLHNRTEGLFSELVSHFSLKVKMDKPLGLL